MSTKNRKPQSEFLRRIVAARDIKCKTKERKLLLLYYVCNADAKGTFYKDIRRIEYDTGLNQSTITRHNKAFIAANLLKIGKGKFNGDANCFALNSNRLAELAEKGRRGYDPQAAHAKAAAARRQAYFRKRRREITITDEGIEINNFKSQEGRET